MPPSEIPPRKSVVKRNSKATQHLSLGARVRLPLWELSNLIVVSALLWDRVINGRKSSGSRNCQGRTSNRILSDYKEIRVVDNT